jgi:uncharacterized protein (DUF1684 family)
MSAGPRAAAAVMLAGMLYGAASESYRVQIEQWRRQREAALTADDGWLTVTGLDWLHAGANTVNGRVFEFHEGKVTTQIDGQTRELRPDTSGKPDVVTSGSLTMFVIARGGKFGIRVKDRNSPLRKEFTGLHYFPPDESYRVTAHMVANPRKIPILNVLGQVEDTPSPGYVEFELHGRKLRLTPVLESPDELFFIFRDLTAGKETYASGRFLNTAVAKDGMVELDFNKAYNPPCAFTPYATCPLPPKENRLDVRIAAGELKYGSH